MRETNEAPTLFETKIVPAHSSTDSQPKCDQVAGNSAYRYF